jgi:polysaccharide export outer membrane protein
MRGHSDFGRRWHARGSRWRAAALGACAVVTLSSCDVIPSSGPLVKEVVSESQAAKRYGFTLVDVDAGVLDAMKAVPHQGLRDIFPDDGPIVPVVGPGDTLSITIFESGVDELFSPPAAQQLTYGTNRVTLPNVTVDRSGMIAVPFAGLVKVAGLTPLDVRSAIGRRLLRQAAVPQILVSVVNNATNVVTVTGAIKNPGRYGLTPASETLLQTIAMAGGSTGLESDTVVHLTRGNRQVSFRLSDLMAHPRDDIHAWPGDFLNMTLDPRTFLIYGAVTQAGAYSLAVDDVTLAQAISRAGGLRDFQADSRGIFLFRYEFPEVLHDIPKASIMAAAKPGAATVDGTAAPVIYKIDLKTAAGIFFSTRLRLRDKDVIFVPTAQTVDWQKYLDLFRMTAEPVTTGTTSAVEMNRAF